MIDQCGRFRAGSLTCLILTSWVIIVSTARTPAQDRPDFSGNWILATPAAQAESVEAITVTASYVRESIRGTPLDPPLVMLAIERTIEGAVRSERFTIGTTGGSVGRLDASASRNGLPNVAHARHSATWDGDKLVIDVRSSGRPATADVERTEVWTLDSQGRLSITVTDRNRLPASTTTVFYRRRS